ncbi:HNH endonuclease signature motif containing protein [Nocardioides cheoyonin]|uniref:HNH endonuclease signature motif containing protein n=1 Tax=Nocardioides cheoyonin TaxID=3156615 RepID=UPI0032B471C2
MKTYLDAFTQPRLAQLAERGKTVPYDRLLGTAFTQMLERIDPDTLPHHGGDATTLIVTIDVNQLHRELGTATIGTCPDGGSVNGTEISAAEARRLACTAGIIPAVLNTHSEVLDLGRKTRLFTPAQRKALRIRYPTCAVDGCDIPAPWTDAHHLHPWATGGLSDMNNAVLFCRHHHRLAHNPNYALTRHPDGSMRFHRRT